MSPRQSSSIELGTWLLLMLRVNAQNTTQNTTADAVVGWEMGPSTRGTLSLLWSCVITIFACTWTVLHLNVPGLEDTSFERLIRKIKWMGINILFPEFILAKAICDLRLALQELRDFDKNLQENRPEFTWRIHSGAKMQEWCWEVTYPRYSGILYRLLGLEQPLGPIPLEPSTLLPFWQRPWNTTQKWTAVHSHYAQMGGLVFLDRHQRPHTDKKCVILTGAKLTSQYVWEPHLSNTHPLTHLVLGKEDIQDKSKADWLVKGFTLLQIIYVILSVLVRHMDGLPVTQLEIATVAFSVLAIFTYMANWWKPKDVSRPTIIHSPRLWGQSIGTSRTQRLWCKLRDPVREAVRAAEWNRNEMSRVPNDLVWVEGFTPLVFVLMSVWSLVFGGVHCLAWNLDFPTRVELICWRIASVSSAVLPILVLALCLAIDQLSRRAVSKHILALRAKVRTLNNHLSPDWWEYMTKPPFESWSMDASKALGAAPAGSRNWEEGSFNLPIDIIEGSNIRDIKLMIIDIRRFRELVVHVLEDQDTFAVYFLLQGTWHHLDIIRGLWQQLEHERHEDGQPVRECYVCRDFVHLKRELDFWRDFDQNFIRHKLDTCMPAAQRPGSSYFEQLIEVFAKSLNQDIRLKRDLENFLQACMQASSTMAISGGIVYTAIRLIIIVLLFTCLRATPMSVYQQTSWTRFIPNIS